MPVCFTPVHLASSEVLEVGGATAVKLTEALHHGITEILVPIVVQARKRHHIDRDGRLCNGQLLDES